MTPLSASQEETIGSLWIRYRGLIERIVRPILRGRTQADVHSPVVETFIDAVQQLQQRGEPNNWEAWLVDVAKKRAKLELGEALERAKVETSLDAMATRGADGSKPPVGPGEDRRNGAKTQLAAYGTSFGADLRSTYCSRDRLHVYPKRVHGSRDAYELHKWDDNLTFAELRAGARFAGDKHGTAAKYLALFLDGQGYKEIAAHFGVTTSTVGTQIHREKYKMLEEISKRNLQVVSIKSDQNRHYQYREDVSKTGQSQTSQLEVCMVIPANRILRAGDVARFLRISRGRVYELLEKGELTGQRLGNTWIVDPEELARFVREGPAKAA